MKKFWNAREPFVWITASGLTLILLIALLFLLVILLNGVGNFWPASVVELSLKDGSRVLGEIIKREKIPQKNTFQVQLKIGNRDIYGLDFRWIKEEEILSKQYPEDIFVLERQENGNFYGRLHEMMSPEKQESQDLNQQFFSILAQMEEKKASRKQQNNEISAVSNQNEILRLKILRLNYQNAEKNKKIVETLQQEQENLKKEFEALLQKQMAFVEEMKEHQAVFIEANGKKKTVAFLDVVRAYSPNTMSLGSKMLYYGIRLKELLWEDPRESNTEGGLFPAIFGTVMMVLIMSCFSFPFGVIAAVYLKEYSKEGFAVQLVRIAVNNLAGIPSIVYGVFGLGFFVYSVGGTLDQLFFPERLPTPTFGTGGILWASLTLSLLTVPVVIVATEEALNSVPKGMREASLALGATKFQSLLRVVLPMASPGILTGFILAMARAAGEVAPLMVTGVVKLAPSLPMDGTFPYLHLDQKFMHLGFHIYDVGFQSPNVEAAKPMVFVTTLILVLVVLIMNSLAIYLRERMKKRYSLKAF